MDAGIGVSVISRDDDIAIVYIKNPPVKMGIAYYTFNALAEAGVDVDIILQTSTGHISGDIIFTVHQVDAQRTREVLEKRTPYRIGILSGFIDKLGCRRFRFNCYECIF